MKQEWWVARGGGVGVVVVVNPMFDRRVMQSGRSPLAVALLLSVVLHAGIAGSVVSVYYVRQILGVVAPWLVGASEEEDAAKRERERAEAQDKQALAVIPPVDSDVVWVRPGIDGTDSEAPAWLGFNESTEHSAFKSTTDQSAMTPETPGLRGEEESPSPPAPPTAAAAPEAAPATTQSSPPPQVDQPVDQPPAPSPLTPSEATPAPATPLDVPVKDTPPAPEAASVPPPSTPPPPPAPPSVPVAEPGEGDPVDQTKDPMEGQVSKPEDAPIPPPEDPVSEAGVEAPKHSEVKENAETKVEKTDTEVEAKPVEGKTQAKPVKSETEPNPSPTLQPPSPPPSVAPKAMTPVVEPKATNRPPAEASPKPVRATPAAPVPSGDPGQQADKEADATSIQQSVEYKAGKVKAGAGLDIRTVRPEFSKYTMLTALPHIPVVELTFDTKGVVKNVRLVRSSGYPDVDEPIINAVWAWTAKGKQLEELRATKPNARLKLVIRMLL